MSESSQRVTIVVAVIGVVGTIAAALIGNWDKIFPPTPPAADGAYPPQGLGKGALPEKTAREPFTASREPLTASRALLTAWRQGNREAALKVAKHDAVDKLFRASPDLKEAVSAKDFSCYLTGTGQRDCQIEGILSFRLKEINQGWQVDSVEY
jgi:hypothetical protein